MGANGRVVIPAEIRRELDLAAGEELVARREGRRVLLERPEDLLNSIQLEWRSAAGASNPVDGLIAERPPRGSARGSEVKNPPAQATPAGTSSSRTSTRLSRRSTSRGSSVPAPKCCVDSAPHATP